MYKHKITVYFNIFFIINYCLLCSINCLFFKEKNMEFNINDLGANPNKEESLGSSKECLVSVDEAKKILDDAGWKDTNGNGIRDKNGTEASFTLWYYSTLAYRESIDIAVAEQAKELGIDMKLQGSNWDDIEGEFSTMSIVWGGGGCDPSSLANYFDSRQAGLGYNNPTIMNDSNVDSLIDSARSQDLNSSYPTWSQAFQAANEHDPYIWIGSVDYTYFVSDNLDISEDTSKVFPHGGDIWGNVYDWKPVNETSK
jgi:peptide/nickel transport system substrate-binding protein